MLSQKDWNEIFLLRKNIHRNPELSGNEFETTRIIKRYLESVEGVDIIQPEKGPGLIAVMKGESEGDNVLYRADIDALPIAETTTLEYKSLIQNKMHACGHDGHTAILAALARVFSYHPPVKGNVILVFQPSEENGQGAPIMVDKIKREGLSPAYGFALHNIPGFQKNAVIVKPNVFASASKGMMLKLIGKTSHASWPESGISPVQAIGELIQFYKKDLKEIPDFKNFVLVTIVHIQTGEKAFGTTPGNAEFYATFRAFDDEDMHRLMTLNQSFIEEISKKYHLKYEMAFADEFPALVNNSANVKWVMEAAGKAGLEILVPVNPFRWSEDFAHYAGLCPIAMFGIGCGNEYPALHNPDYDFPDEIIETGVKMFYGIYQVISK